ncbi:Ltp family lipoprotein [Jeotgalibaca porci]|uniref:Ltp family lipoprotein n=1 Tax=Jeotgalibaca porci TaxID=1868793 RepID=UPI0035A17ADE
MNIKKISLVIFVSLLAACAQDVDSAGTLSSDLSSTETALSIEKIERKLYLNVPKYEMDSFVISGKASSNITITAKIKSKTVEKVTSSDRGTFEMSGSIPDSGQIEYVISDGTTTENIFIQSNSLRKQLKAERDEAYNNKLIAQKDKEKAAEEVEAAKKKAEEEEATKKSEADKKAKEESDAQEAAKQAEADRIAKEESEAEEAAQQKEDEKNNASREQQNALQTAQRYLNFTAFSKESLYDQLLFEKFPEDAAQFAVDNIDVNWDKQALDKANSYLDFSAFSSPGLYDQLVYEGFTTEQTSYAINNIQVDWNEQALQKAISYLEFSSFSDQGLYDQLIYEGFTPTEVQYAISNLP